jgi:class I lanthipeptide synthase
MSRDNAVSLRRDYVASGFFVLRTPLLPFDAFEAWGGRANLEGGLMAIYERPEVREALYLASPGLHAMLARSSQHAVCGRKALNALAAYFARMAGRATPFGLFAGCSVGEIGEHTRLELAPLGNYRRHTRVDMDY